MSHVADVQLQVTDLAALKQAVEKMGGTFVEGQRTFRWYGRFLNDWASSRAAVNRISPENFGKCEHAIRVPGVGYEIGVIKHPSGTGYELIFDQFGEGKKLEAWLGGENYGRVKQNYGAVVTTRELARKGYRVTTTTTPAGDIRISATR